MDLEKIKEFENVKKELLEDENTYKGLIRTRNNKYIEDAYHDFKVFFTEKEFNVIESQDELEAIYGETKIKMCKTKSDNSYLEVYLILNLKFSMDKYNYEYEFLLSELNNRPKINTALSNNTVVQYIEFDEKIMTLSDENLNKEIEDVNKRLKDVKQKIGSFMTTEWAYGLKRVYEGCIEPKCEYKSFNQVLGGLFK